MAGLTYCSCLLLNLILSVTLLTVGVYVFIKEKCWPDNYTEEECIVGMSIGGFGIVVMLGSALVSYIVCVPRKGDKKDSEEETDAEAEATHVNIAVLEVINEPVDGVEETKKLADKQAESTEKMYAAIVDIKTACEQPLADIKPTTNVTAVSKQPQEENKPVTPAALADSAKTPQRHQPESPNAATSVAVEPAIEQVPVEPEPSTSA